MDERGKAGWARVQAVLDEALDAPVAARAALLAVRCGDDAALRAEVESLLAAAEASTGFLETIGPERRETLPPPALRLARVGPYRLVRLLGRGGMGEVHEAERDDGAFEARVAVKLIRADIAVSAERFRAERQILAGLEHPGIARLLDGGVAEDGRPYMVVEYVAGEAIDRWCAARQPDLAGRIALFRQVAEAVAHAHRHLVVHRDLKPANVLVTADGRAKLLDFGIATLLEAPGATREQTRVQLTPDYAAPEQLQGGAVSTATDVYALGLLLHELLTGVPARDTAGLPLAMVLKRLLEREPGRPSAHTRVLPAKLLEGDLDAIVAKALRSEPGARYGSVEALLEDLDRWAQQRPVVARGGARAYVAGRFLRRHRFAVAAATALALALFAGIAGVLWQAHEAAIQRDAARAEAARANAVRDYVLHMFRSAAEEQAGGAPVSAQDVLRKAAGRVREAFRADPSAARDTLLALGDLFYYLNDDPGAEAVFRAFLDTPGAAPAERAAVQLRLAEVRYNRGAGDEARALLGEALPVLRADPERQAERLDDADSLAISLAREAGDVAGALALAEPYVARLRARLGNAATATADALNELAATQLEADRPEAAAATWREALAIYAKAGEAESANASLILAGSCMADAALRRVVEAEACYRDATQRLDALYGESSAMASARLQWARALIEVNRSDEALRQIDRAEELARRYYDSQAGLLYRAHLLRIRALIAADRLAAAHLLIEREPSGPDGQRRAYLAGLRALEQARLGFSEGRRDAATASLAAARDAMAADSGATPLDRVDLAALEQRLHP